MLDRVDRPGVARRIYGMALGKAQLAGQGQYPISGSVQQRRLDRGYCRPQPVAPSVVARLRGGGDRSGFDSRIAHRQRQTNSEQAQRQQHANNAAGVKGPVINGLVEETNRRLNRRQAAEHGGHITLPGLFGLERRVGVHRDRVSRSRPRPR